MVKMPRVLTLKDAGGLKRRTQGRVDLGGALPKAGCKSFEKAVGMAHGGYQGRLPGCLGHSCLHRPTGSNPTGKPRLVRSWGTAVGTGPGAHRVYGGGPWTGGNRPWTRLCGHRGTECSGYMAGAQPNGCPQTLAPLRDHDAEARTCDDKDAARVHPGSQQVAAQVLGSLLSTWETRIDFLAPDFGLAQPWMLQAFEE